MFPALHLGLEGFLAGERGELDFPRAADSGYDAVNYIPRRVGTYTVLFEAYGWKPTRYKSRVYSCAG